MGQTVSIESVQDLSNQVVLITGANAGIGKQTALRLAKHNPNLILACRSEERTRPLIEEIKQKYENVKVEFIELDLSDLNSVVQCAEKVKQKYEKIDILINNAGVMMSQREQTVQGFEMNIGVNHFGHFVLTNQLLPLIKKSEQGRIISLTSIAHDEFMGKKIELDLEDLNYQKRKFEWLPVYGQSKLANILFIKKLQRLVEEQNSNIICVSIHPGSIKTDILRHIYNDAGAVETLFYKFFGLFLESPEKGSDSTLFCCLQNHEKLVKGGYYIDSLVHQSSKASYDPYLAENLWKLNNQQVKDYIIEW